MLVLIFFCAASILALSLLLRNSVRLHILTFRYEHTCMIKEYVKILTKKIKILIIFVTLYVLNNYIMIKKITLIFLLISSLTYAQRTCGVTEITKKKLENPTYKAMHMQKMALFEQYSNMQFRTGETFIIPVAVHFPEGSESDRSCLEALAQSQIDILNNDYKAQNADIVNWDNDSSYYPNTNTGSLSILFVIATQNHPANTDNDLIEGGPAVTIGYNFGNGSDSDVKWSGYLNLVVKNIGGGVLGYSPLGGIPLNGDSVVIDASSFGSGTGCPGHVPAAPYNLGRTLTHELGHHFNLMHVWGDDPGSCAVDDNLNDTPNTSGPTYGSPAVGSVVKCGSVTLTMNYMDYTNDAAMYMFTEGQMNRSFAYLMSIYGDYKQNVLAEESIEIAEKFNIYPNPVDHNSNLIIDLGSNMSKSSLVEIYDVSGKRVLSNKYNGTSNIEIPMHSFSKGVYIIKLIGNNVVKPKKMIIS